MFISGDGTIWTRGDPEHGSPSGTCRLFDLGTVAPGCVELVGQLLWVEVPNVCTPGDDIPVRTFSPHSLGVGHMHRGW